jgi:hypothetical protein
MKIAEYIYSVRMESVKECCPCVAVPHVLSELLKFISCIFTEIMILVCSLVTVMCRSEPVEGLSVETTAGD